MNYNEPVTITMQLGAWRAMLDQRRFGKDRGFTIEDQNARARAYKELDRVVRGHMLRQTREEVNARLKELGESGRLGEAA